MAKILHADNPLDQVTFGGILRTAGHQVTPVDSIRQAIEALSLEDFDIVITHGIFTTFDDGLRFAEELHFHGHKVILLSDACISHRVRTVTKTEVVCNPNRLLDAINETLP